MSNQVKMPLLGQSVRMLHSKGLTTIKHNKDKKYLIRVTRYEDNMIIEEEIERDYPVTPEYVASFAESADYHTDVNGAVAKSKSRINLGDVRDMQEVARMDSGDLNALAIRFDALNKTLQAEIERRKQPGQLAQPGQPGQPGQPAQPGQGQQGGNA